MRRNDGIQGISGDADGVGRFWQTIQEKKRTENQKIHSPFFYVNLIKSSCYIAATLASM